ncbi:MAG TPA: thioredoxin family protein [Xanthobacteraceae bacterium]|nr:thioredoxin family protein [Xanthobacteraceae bacterium]
MEVAVVETHKIVSHDEWIAARKAYLLEEKAFSKVRDALAKKRRELPWEKVEKNYVFDTPDGKRSLADLFGGKNQLIIYHFMLGPGWEAGCPSCSLIADHFDGATIHLAQRDIAFAVVSRAPLPEIERFKARMGWKFQWASSFGSDFNFDYHVSASPEEKARGGEVEYNYQMTTFPSEERPGASVFFKDVDGQVFHTYSTYGRGLDILIGAYNLIDLAPKGRDEDGLKFSMAWVRHHDRYDGAAVDTKASYRQPKSAACCD